MQHNGPARPCRARPAALSCSRAPLPRPPSPARSECFPPSQHDAAPASASILPPPAHFRAVAEKCARFPELPPAELFKLLSRDDLVCSSEEVVVRALADWYHGQSSDEKQALMPSLLPLVRWPLLPEADRDRLMERIEFGHDGGDTPVKDRRAPMFGKTANVPRPMRKLISPSLWPPLQSKPTPPVAPPLDASSSPTPPVAPPLDASSSDSQQRCGSEASPVTRRFSWGRLVRAGGTGGGSAPTDGASTVLKCTQPYIVGRSRRANLRIGHDAPTPYISGQHFRVYHELRWPPLPVDKEEVGPSRMQVEADKEAALEAELAAGPQGAEAQDEGVDDADDTDDAEAEDNVNLPVLHAGDPPLLEAWIEDLSQNGTFVNQRLVGKSADGKPNRTRLRNNDVIELVFPQGMQPEGYNFPRYTFYDPKPPMRDGWSQTDKQPASAGSQTD